MRISEIKAIAAARSVRNKPWNVSCSAPNLRCSVLVDEDCVAIETIYEQDAEFIAMAANNIDKLLAVVDAAFYCATTDYMGDAKMAIREMQNILEAKLKELESE